MSLLTNKLRRQLWEEVKRTSGAEDHGAFVHAGVYWSWSTFGDWEEFLK